MLATPLLGFRNFLVCLMISRILFESHFDTSNSKTNQTLQLSVPGYNSLNDEMMTTLSTYSVSYHNPTNMIYESIVENISCCRISTFNIYCNSVVSCCVVYDSIRCFDKKVNLRDACLSNMLAYQFWMFPNTSF